MSDVRKISGSKYWYATVRDATGKRFTRSTKQTDKTAARRVARNLAVEAAVSSTHRLALSKALVELHAHKVRKKVSVSELEIVATKGARLIEHFGPAFNCNAIQAADLDAYVDARRLMPVHYNARGKPSARLVSDSTIRKELNKLLEALRQCRRKGLYTGPDPITLMPTVLAPDTPRERWLDDHEYRALLAALDERGRGGRQGMSKRDYVIVYVHCGVRYSELYRITAADLAIEQRQVYVKGTKTKRAPRWVPLSEAALEVLQRRAKAYPTGPLFPYRWLAPNMEKSLKRACKRAGIEPVSCNDLRRTFVSWCCRHGESELNVQKFVGHSPGSTLVRRVYAQLAPEAGRAAIANFPMVTT